ncbi:peroxisomal sarcosine oxidase isoform X2 [Haemorhous mexicanus]|uniref:peroxisomal sarcosine oxidase isoform X2 n=1 Tax=Haemorhous mexicanus TaxID=30427 RepID=UPI0028BF3D8A|nr:peroxisomal sarcosine oxidase isoform X2 [Haemorhous mexicanus]
MAAPSQPQKSTYDVIVIGAGIQGSFTAFHLAQRHKDTLLLEQFLLPHSRGSSHGQSRIIRSAYPQEYYSRMMPDCFRLWQQLEAETGTSLYRQTGLVMLGPPGEPELEACRRNLGVDEVLDAAALSRRFPGFRLQAGQVAVLDSTAGVLFADRALRAVQEVFRRHGGTLRDGEKVLSIQPGATVTVTTTAGVYKAPRLIITTGAWTGAFVEQLGLRLPLQVCHHHGSPTDPEKRDQVPSSAPRPDIAVLSSFISSYLPGLETQPAVMETCLYTNTPDEDFILDRHPKFSNIVIGAGFSGHGFKLAPVVGKLLCELSLGEEPSYNMAHFAITRFPGVLGAAQ